jgi:hypothetical protein
MLKDCVSGWVHTDGTICDEYLAPPGSVPPSGYWCTTHQMYVRHPESPPVCDRCGGYCTNGAECAVSQFLGKPRDWRGLDTASAYEAQLIPPRVEAAPEAAGTETTDA